MKTTVIKNDFNFNNKKFNNKDEINDFAEDFFLRYHALNDNHINDIEEKFIIDLATKCAGVFEYQEIFEILNMLKEKNLLDSKILESSTIVKVNKTSNKKTNKDIKDEILELASNKIVTHYNDSNEKIRETKTYCYTLSQLANKLKIGSYSSSITYAENGKRVIPNVLEATEPEVNFKINNILIKHKQDTFHSTKKEYLRIIIIPSMEYHI